MLNLDSQAADPILKQFYKPSRKMKSKIPKETKEKIATKIRYLIEHEGKPQDQAIAMAYSMEAPKYSKKKKK